jgi:hypothetical protein
MFYIAYTTTKKAVFAKECRCEHCGLHFVYPMEREADGFGSAYLGVGRTAAKQSAQEEAEAELQQLFAEDFDFVPCPGCGRYQKDMIRRDRKEGHVWMKGTAERCILTGLIFFGVLILGAALIFAGPGPKDMNDSCVGFCITSGILLPLSGFFLIRHGCKLYWRYKQIAATYDPNRDSERNQRLHRAHELGAIPYDEYLKMRAVDGKKGTGRYGTGSNTSEIDLE